MLEKENSIGFELLKVDYNRKIADSSSGEIVGKAGELFLLVNFPEMEERTKQIFEKAFEEMKSSGKSIAKAEDVYFFLKNFCLENLILLNSEEREIILQLLSWEALRESVLTPLMDDCELEEIAINGPKREIMVYHNKFGWLKTNIVFYSEDRIKNLLNKMAAPLGRQLSFHTPMLNAVLEDGSRLNATMNPIAFTGINATIRKFKKNPLTPIQIASSKTISLEAFAFLWACMETSSSILICGNTGSGKTTTLNSLFCFLPKKERIVVVEETPEIVLPQEQAVKMNTAEEVGIGLEKLIENTFRMRPDRVIVGEIRSKAEAKAFIDTMLAGQARGSYATFHAESAKEAIERFISFGIDERALASLDLIIVQKRLNKISNGKWFEERRIVEIAEIVEGFEKNKKENKLKNNSKISGKENNNKNNERSIALNVLFKYNHNKQVLEKCSESKRIFEKIMHAYSCEENEVKKIIRKKELLLEGIGKEVSFEEFSKIVESAEE